MSAELTSEDFLFVNKPSGVPTHQPSPDRLGFVEWCSSRLQQKLFVCHRLDKDTSGALIFAKSKEAAAFLSNLFENHKVEKEYWFISHKKSELKEWTVKKTKDARGVERPYEEGNNVGVDSLTRFQRINDQGTLFLYKAFPQTGKTHQIRKHAIHSKIPILGDQEYGGKPFPRLMLHAKKISFQLGDKVQEFEPVLPKLFTDLELCRDPQMSSWIHSIERREILFPELMNSKQAIRLCHSETGDLRIDKAGHRLVLGWWKSEPPSSKELLKIEKLMALFDFKDWLFQWRPGVNQKDQLVILKTGSEYTDSHWSFLEGESRYVGALDRGQNFGLFLDQRQRRDWVKSQSSGKRVLNLFSFTCGFSLSAALGGATEVVSVDSFQKYLDWGKENFQANQLNPDDYQFRAMDALEYLKYAAKKNMKFDIIICDPPSFSRNKKSKKVFRVEKDYKNLLDACFAVLAPKGSLLFSTNFEKWDHKQWEKEISKWGSERQGLKVSASPPQWDYEWQNQEANMKSFLIKTI